MSTNNTQYPFVQCFDCSFITTSQGHLGIHKAKIHRVDIPENIKSVTIVRLFPDGKSYHRCLCNSIIASFANFKRHFQDLHKGISLNISAKCTICDRSFSHCHGAGVHCCNIHKKHLKMYFACIISIGIFKQCKHVIKSVLN